MYNFKIQQKSATIGDGNVRISWNGKVYNYGRAS